MQKSAELPIHSSCRETGSFVAKGGCYALRRDDGAEFWLEMDRIPLHLLDRQVLIEGERYSNLICVEVIGPAA